MAYKTAESWIGEMMGDADRKCKAISVVRNLPTGGIEDIYTHQMAGKQWTIEQVFKTLIGRALHNVQDKPGRHTFELRAFFDDNSSFSEHTTFICEEGEYKATGSKNVAEGASLAGIVGQHMRQNENLHNIVKTMAEGIAVRALQRELEYEKIINGMRIEVNEAYTIVREASFRQTMQEHEAAMTRLKFERESTERGLMVKMAPSLLSAITGQEIPNPVGDSEILDKAAEFLDEQKLVTLVKMNVIPDDFASMMLMRIKQTRDKKAKEAEAMSKVPEGETGDVSNVLPLLRSKFE
jgi:hypothetical protein